MSTAISSEARFEGERKRATAFDEETGMPLPPAVGSHGEVSKTLNVRPDGTLVDRQTGKALNRTAAGGPAKEFMQAKTDVEATQKTPETPQSPTDNAVPSRARALGEGSNASETSAKRTRTPATGDEEVDGRAQEGRDDRKHLVEYLGIFSGLFRTKLGNAHTVIFSRS